MKERSCFLALCFFIGALTVTSIAGFLFGHPEAMLLWLLLVGFQCEHRGDEDE